MPNKIRVKVGHIEIELETAEVLAEDKLDSLLKKATDVYKQNPLSAEAFGNNLKSKSTHPSVESAPGVCEIDLSLETFLHRLNSKKPSDIIINTIAFIILVKGKQFCSKEEIKEEVNSASIKLKNFTRDFAAVTNSGKITKTASGNYVLEKTKLEEIKASVL